MMEIISIGSSILWWEYIIGQIMASDPKNLELRQKLIKSLCSGSVVKEDIVSYCDSIVSECHQGDKKSYNHAKNIGDIKSTIKNACLLKHECSGMDIADVYSDMHRFIIEEKKNDQ